MTILGLDFETFSRLDLKKVGSSRYSRHSSTRPLLLGWAIDDGPVEVVRFAEGQKMPKILREALLDPEVKKAAWNAPFERRILANAMGIEVPFEEWYDTMVLAYSLSFPGQLEKVAKILGFPEDKQKLSRGKALIRKFCGPRKPTKTMPWTFLNHISNPDEWEEFVEYCRRDVEVEREIRKKMGPWDMSQEEWELWYLDQEINERGIPINMNVVENAIVVSEAVVARRLEEMKKITGLQNPNSNPQLLGWLMKNGYKFEDLKKGHVERAYKDLDEDAHRDHPELARVLELRLEVSKTSVKKYNALKRATDRDGYLRGAFQFCAAGRTWRWGGRIYQPQNLARPVKYLEDCQEEAVRHLEHFDARQIELLYDKPMDLLSTCVRPVVQAPPGFVLLDADLNAIENRVLGWLADDQKILDVFRQKRDPYIDFATYMFKESYEDLWHEYKAEGKKDKRTLAKPGVLGCGYLLGPGEQRENKRTGVIEATGLLGYAWNMGVEMTPEQSALSVKVFRDTFEDVVQFWYDMEKAARLCIVTKRPQRVGFIRFDMSGPFMRMHLPSGHPLFYYRPRIESRRTPWGKMKPTITYEGLKDGRWARQPTHPGKLVENATQAVARDILAHGMKLAKKEGLDTRLHVHDQVVPLIRESKAENGLKVLNECMSVVPDWAPGLILGSEGTIAKVFMKD